MRRVPWGALLALFATGLGFCGVQGRLDRGLKTCFAGEHAYLLVPPVQGIRAIATGFEQVIADGFWLEFLQFNGERQVDGGYRPAEVRRVTPLFRFITDLDGHFSYAYQFGAWVLSDAERPAEAAELLALGFKRLPRDPLLPFNRGFVEFLFRDNYLEAAHWFLVADAIPGCPPRARRMAASMYAKGNKADLARLTWQQIYQSAKDEQTRRIARRALAKLQKEAS